MPETMPSFELHVALEVMYADPQDEYVGRFLNRSLKYAERVLAEDKCRSQLCASGFPLNRAGVHTARALCIALLENRTDAESWRQVAEDYMAWLETANGLRSPDPIEQAFLLCAVRADLIRRAPDVALSRLQRIRGPVKWATCEAGLWRRLTEAAAAGEAIPRDLAAEVEEYFEQVRHPEFNAKTNTCYGFMQPEIGAILWHYVRYPNKPIDWHVVVDWISR